MTRRLNDASAKAARGLLTDLRVSAFGIHSPRLHRILIADALRGLVDCRVEEDHGAVLGLVLAAPARYWRTAPLRHPLLGLECAFARLARRRRGRAANKAPSDPPHEAMAGCEEGPAPRTWSEPGDAWRIIFVGTAAGARGKGVAGCLYRAMAADRPLVARVARDNVASLRLHAATGWRLFRDGDVVLAVHDGPGQSAATGAGRR